MASLSTSSDGSRRLVFTDPLDGKRKTLYLGRIGDIAAAKFKTNLDALLIYRKEGEPHDAAVVRWLASLSDEHAGKLAALGLIEARVDPKAQESLPTLAGYLARFIESKPHVKQSTRIANITAIHTASALLGKNRRLSDVDERLAGTLPREMAGYSKAYTV